MAGRNCQLVSFRLTVGGRVLSGRTSSLSPESSREHWHAIGFCQKGVPAARKGGKRLGGGVDDHGKIVGFTRFAGLIQGHSLRRQVVETLHPSGQFSAASMLDDFFDLDIVE